MSQMEICWDEMKSFLDTVWIFDEVMWGCFVMTMINTTLIVPQYLNIIISWYSTLKHTSYQVFTILNSQITCHDLKMGFMLNTEHKSVVAQYVI